MLFVALLLVSLLAVALAGGAMVARVTLEMRVQVLELLELAIRRQLPVVPLLRQAALGQPRRVARAFTRLARDLEQGEDLGEALEWALPDSFPPSARAAIGSAAGTAELPDVLRAMTQNADDGLALQHRTTMALLYPFSLVFLLVIVFEAVGWLFAVPGVWAQPTWLLGMQYRASPGASPAVAFFVVVASVLAACMLWRRSAMLRRCTRDLLWRVPWRSKASRLLASGQYLDTLAGLVRAGVALPTAMVRAVGAVGHPRDEARIRTAAAQLEAGAPFVDAIRSTGLPAFAVASVCAASQAMPAQLADAMSRSAREARTRHVTARERLLDLLNPALLAIVGLCVGAIVMTAATTSVRVSEGYLPW